MTHKKNAFTLIELLVVIAIIALLLSIVMPALKKAKKKANDIICRTNIKSLQLATILYTGDFAGKMPVYDLAEGLWINLISDYLENVDKARYCPMTRVKVDPSQFGNIDWGGAFKAWMWSWGTDEVEYGSYAINGWFYSYTTPPTTELEKYFETTADAKEPAITPVFGDSIWVDAWPRVTDFCPDNFNLDYDANNGGKMSMFITNRHRAKTNMGFLDGHQGPIELSALWSLKWNRTFEKQFDVTRTPSGKPIYP
jgi:prepilin-type N-terminal cleavage/methylation domain-containing protein/prepilin-type processing-associated H-X9-DG protein